MDSFVDNYFLVALLYWPLALLIAAGLNMLIWWTFSWSELLMDYAIGVVIGTLFFVYTHGSTSWPVAGLLIMSHGLFGVLHVTGSLADPGQFFWASAGATVGCSLIAAALDRAAVKAGKTMTFPRALLSLLIFFFKAPFSLVTSAVGLLIWLAGLIRSFIGTGGAVGFLAGVLYAEWNNTDTSGEWTTTVGFTVHSWKNTFDDVMEHELYHSRQCIYLHDWMIPAWLLGELLRVIFRRGQKDNPIERAAYAY